MADWRNAAGVPLSYKGFIWSKILDTLAGSAAANGDMLYRTGGRWTRLPIATNGRLLKAVGGVPTWGALPAVYQTSDLVITDSTTGSTYVDTELVITLVPGTYRFEIQTFGTCNSVPDMKFRLHFTGTLSHIRYLVTTILESNASYFNGILDAADIDSFYTSTANFVTHYYGTIVVTVAGDLSHQVAQSTPSATAITAINRGSSMLFWQIA